MYHTLVRHDSLHSTVVERGHILCGPVLLLPTSGIRIISFFILVGPCPLHEIAVSAILRSLPGRGDTS